MQTGSLIAIVIAVLVLLAIWWYTTRAGRARAAQRHDEGSAALTDGADAAERGAPDGRTGPIVTESMGAESSAAVDAAPATAAAPDAGDNTFAGVQGSALDGAGADAEQGTGTRAGAGAEANAALAGAAAGTAASLATATSSSAATRAPADLTQAGPDPVAARAGGTGAPGAAGRDRPRFDPDNDGHPVPGDAAAAAPADTATTVDTGALPSTEPALAGDYTVDCGDALVDVQEMIKILNLRETDAERLGLSEERFEALRHGDRDGLDDDTLTAVADRLRRMIR